ncbi:MAG: OmpA family protein [Psychroflexus sp.]|nr:OmpA family protein [Psychroflexus sp.]
MIKKVIMLSGFTLLTMSCVSKKKLTQSENKVEMRDAEIAELQEERDSCQSKQESIEDQMMNYQAQIEKLQDDNENTLRLSKDGSLENASTRNKVKRILKDVDDARLADAQNFQDSLNIAFEENIKKSLRQKLGDDADFAEDLHVKVHQPLVEISIGESILFKSGSAFVNPKAYPLLKHVSQVLNSESSMMIRVEGHTDEQAVTTKSYVKDNWELSLKRSASVVRIFEDKFNVDGARMIASGRGKYVPVSDNESDEGRRRNRRTEIKLAPDLKTFMEILGN